MDARDDVLPKRHRQPTPVQQEETVLAKRYEKNHERSSKFTMEELALQREIDRRKTDPADLKTIADAIIRLNKERGYTFCVIEHDMDFISKLCDPVICMAEGKVLAEGTIQEIKDNEQVIEAYLGTGLKNKVTAGVT